MFKGAIFDLDGTLLDSMTAWDSVGADFLLSHGITPPVDIEDVLKPLSFYQSAQYFKDEYALSYTPEQIMSLVYQRVADKYKFSIPLKTSVNRYLEQLKQKGIKMCIATASNKELAKEALKRLNILQYFEFIITCDEMGKGKDEPDIYLKAAELLRLDIKELCVFEDALYCIKTAKKAGFEVIGIYDESSENDKGEINKLCSQFVYSFEELLQKGRES